MQRMLTHTTLSLSLSPPPPPLSLFRGGEILQVPPPPLPLKYCMYYGQSAIATPTLASPCRGGVKRVQLKDGQHGGLEAVMDAKTPPPPPPPWRMDKVPRGGRES